MGGEFQGKGDRMHWYKNFKRSNGIVVWEAKVEERMEQGKEERNNTKNI